MEAEGTEAVEEALAEGGMAVVRHEEATEEADIAEDEDEVAAMARTERAYLPWTIRLGMRTREKGVW